MDFDPNLHHRRSIRLKDFDYRLGGYYFVTFATANLECLFGEIVDGQMVLNQFGEIARQEWLRAEEVREEVELDEFVIMPNHIHGIIIIKGAEAEEGTIVAKRARRRASLEMMGAFHRNARTADPPAPPGLQAGSLGAIISQFKSICNKRINKLRQTPQAQVWHRNYYESVITKEKALLRIRIYIAHNPQFWNRDKFNET